MEEQLKNKLNLVLTSQFTTCQKVALLHSTTNPAVTYVTANISDEKQSITLKRCSDLDKNIQKNVG